MERLQYVIECWSLLKNYRNDSKFYNMDENSIGSGIYEWVIIYRTI